MLREISERCASPSHTQQLLLLLLVVMRKASRKGATMRRRTIKRSTVSAVSDNAVAVRNGRSFSSQNVKRERKEKQQEKEQNTKITIEWRRHGVRDKYLSKKAEERECSGERFSVLSRTLT